MWGQAVRSYHLTDKELQLGIGLVCSGVLVLHPNAE